VNNRAYRREREKKLIAESGNAGDRRDGQRGEGWKSILLILTERVLRNPTLERDSAGGADRRGKGPY